MLAFVASCATGPRQGAQTQYLEAFAPQSVPQSATYNTDTVSYWDGEGVSGPASIVIDLSDQRAYFYKGSTLAGVSSLSTGDEGHADHHGQIQDHREGSRSPLQSLRRLCGRGGQCGGA